MTSSIQFAETYWECWLERGDARRRDRRQRLALAVDRGRAGRRQSRPPGCSRATARRAGIAEAIARRAAPSISRLPPAQGGAPLLLEADARRQRRLRVERRATPCRRAPGCAWSRAVPGAGIVRVRANGETLLEQAVTPGQPLEFTRRTSGGWVRASLPAARGRGREAGPGLRAQRPPGQHLRLRPAGRRAHLADLPRRLTDAHT